MSRFSLIGKSLLAYLTVTLLVGQAAALEAEWADLFERCDEAVANGDHLNVAGLEERLPNFTGALIEQEPYGYRLELEPTGPGGRALPSGIWADEGGRLEMWLLEYPTRAGFRAICEVRNGRGAVGVTEAEASTLRDLFLERSKTAQRYEVATDNPRIAAFQFEEHNARGCPIITSFSADAESGYLRSSVSEAAGAPNCGGPSLARDLITPHGVAPPKVQGG